MNTHIYTLTDTLHHFDFYSRDKIEEKLEIENEKENGNTMQFIRLICVKGLQF